MIGLDRRIEQPRLDQDRVHRRIEQGVIDDVVEMAVGVVVAPARRQRDEPRESRRPTAALGDRDRPPSRASRQASAARAVGGVIGRFHASQGRSQFRLLAGRGYHDKATGAAEGRRAMTDDEAEPFATASEPPPRALTRLSPLVRRLVAPNPSPSPSTAPAAISSARARSRSSIRARRTIRISRALLAAVAGEKVETIVVTHTHRDHSRSARSGCARRPARAWSALRRHAPRRWDGRPRRLARPRLCARRDPRRRRAAVKAPGFTSRPSPRRAIAPITSASRCRGERAVLRRSRDGLVDLGRRAARRLDGAYMASLDKLRGARRDDLLARARRPGRRPQRYLRGLINHRRQREAAILARLEAARRQFPRSSPRSTPASIRG